MNENLKILNELSIDIIDFYFCSISKYEIRLQAEYSSKLINKYAGYNFIKDNDTGFFYGKKDNVVIILA